MRREFWAGLSTSIIAIAGAGILLALKEGGMIAQSNALGWLIGFGGLFFISVIILLWSFFLPKKSDNKSEDKMLLNQAYTKVLEVLPKMKIRLGEIPYKINKKQISKSTLHIINLDMLKTGAGTTAKERFNYFVHLTKDMDNSNIKLIDYINEDTDWKKLDKELNKYTMQIKDTKLKRSIWLYKAFIIGTYYERVFNEYNSLLFDTHIGIQNRDTVNELLLNEISTRIAQRIEKLRAKNK
jgi:hypothetical protein